MSIAPSPIAALNRAVAVAEAEGAEAALAIIDKLELREYQLFHSARAELLRRLGRQSEALQAYETAITRTENMVERRFLERRRDGVRFN